jgi:hypothetical protein
VDSGCDEFYPHSPSMLSECVEVYSTNEIVPQTQYNKAEEWAGNEFHQTAYAPNASVQPYEDFSTQIPTQFIDDQAVQTYDELVKSPFIDEICNELDQWNQDPCFAQEMEAEKATIANSQIYNQVENDMNDFDNIDLFEFCNF